MQQVAHHWLSFLSILANKLLYVCVTTAATKPKWYAWGRTDINTCNRLGILVAEKLIYVMANNNDKQLDGDELVALDVCWAALINALEHATNVHVNMQQITCCTLLCMQQLGVNLY